MSLSKLYGFIVYNCNIDPNYFFDEMTPEEVEAVSAAYYENYKERWEQVRMVNHAIISSQSSKPIKITDVMKFAWDEDDTPKEVERLDQSEIDKIRKKHNIST